MALSLLQRDIALQQNDTRRSGVNSAALLLHVGGHVGNARKAALGGPT